ncbi:hypothetical protein B0J12DRAFT_581494 [Macrophomina phaseolina]|uniref:Carrier domain-containing protein n=1 Tax=Macrophomina phaseolina TaxID=35725 RepID=A0ABQ8G1S1_9PEZI|nr:hypothetical protein B0J12DRAFT_581494 [Macrophomina phaseolina]
MGGLEQPAFRRARFDPLGQELARPTGHDSIRSLPDLINFNAAANPDHTFCLQAEVKAAGDASTYSYSAIRLSFKDLKQAVDACSCWLEESFAKPEQGEFSADGTRLKPPPVALYMESDVGLFIYLAALLASGTPAVLLSARLSAESVRHLLKETGAQSILLSKRTERLIARDVADLVQVKAAAPFSLFLEPSVAPAARTGTRLHVDEKDIDVLILHSSGTTGLPKPIRLAHRYLLGYSACHEFPERESIAWPNLSTLPLYHGFGLLAPCLSLSVGMSCVFPPSSIIPAAHSTMELLASFGVQSLMTVPSILEDMLNLSPTERDRALSLLRPLRFIAIGGGPLKPEVGGALASDGAKVLNHYGATEIGAIAPIIEPKADYDYRYLRLRTDLGLQLHPAGHQGEELERFKLVGHPFGWGSPFEVQDELFRRPDSQRVEIKILGRRDDLIVLQNGEKVIPRVLEQALSEDPAIKTAVCVGQGFFEVAVLVEPSSSAPADVDAFAEHVWQLVSQLNASLDQHARISSRHAIIVKPPGKAIPRSDKGSVMRREVLTVFEAEIRAAYDALDLGSARTDLVLEADGLESGIRKLVGMVMSKKSTADGGPQPDDDLFELGMDSLQATRLSRVLNSSVEKTAGERLTAAFIYQNPSLAKLTSAVGTILRGELRKSEEKAGREVQMRALAEEYIQAIDADGVVTDSVATDGASRGAVVLLTGSTGNLGAHTLACLARSKRVAQVICLNRRTPVTGDDLRARQEQVNSAAGVGLSAREWDKVSFLAGSMQAPELGLSKDQLEQLTASISHIVHLAWPMDFNRQLASFRPQLNALKTLIQLARAASQTGRHVRPRLMLASSISVVRHHGQRTVPEKALDDPLVTTAMGYAEAKWVCERMLHHVSERWAHHCTPMIVRIGQLSGPEQTDGIWKTEEHVPALIKASQKVSAFPDLTGLGDGRIPFEAWLQRMAATGVAASLTDFFQNDFRALANGSVVLDTRAAREASAHLRGCGGLSRELIVEYIGRWKKSGFLA